MTDSYRQLCSRILIISLFLGGIFACKTTQTTTTQTDNKKPIIAKIGKEALTVDDFKYVYEKSLINQDSAYQKQHLENYINLYLNYKLKIIEAQSLGIDTTASFRRELKSYEEQLAKSYLTDKKMIDSLVIQAYNRLKEEVNVSHILVKVAKEAEPQDTVMAYEKILDIRKKALEGKNSFEELALQYSQDSVTVKKNGNLGYFTALQMVYPFEEVSYKTPKGNISELIRTKYGYHFLKVLDRRMAQGKITTAHIMFKIPKKATKNDSLQIYNKAQSVYDRLQKGESWDMLCRQFSDDGASKDKSGVLPPFGIGMVIPEFEKVAFELQTEGQITSPILTPYGYHLIKLVKKKGLEPFPEIENTLRQKVTKDSRLEFTQQNLVNRLKRENKLTENKQNLDKALQKADAKLLQGVWEYNTQDILLKEPLISFENTATKIKKTHTIGDFYAYAKERQIPRPELKTPTYALKLLYLQFTDVMSIEFERNILPLKYPDFQLLIKEYKEGMMLFQMMNDNVWNKALIDETGLGQYYQSNRNRYVWNDRANATVFYCANEKVANEVKDLLQQRYFPMNQYNLEKIYFEKDKNTLSTEAIKYLNDLLVVLQDTTIRIEIAGFADPTEKPEISKNRIKPVVDYLVFRKINIERIITKDYGIYKPVSNKDRNLNRRVEFSLFSTRKKTLENQLNNSANPLNLRIAEGKFQKGDNEFVDKVDFKKGLYTLKDQKDKNKIVLIEITQVEPSRIKNYDEAKGQLITDYQNYLEINWLAQLKQKYPIELNQEELQKMIKK